MMPTVQVNHFPMVREPCDAMFYPEFSLWCGTTATADWHTRYNAICSVYGHLHIPAPRGTTACASKRCRSATRESGGAAGLIGGFGRSCPTRSTRRVPQRVRRPFPDHRGDADKRAENPGADRQPAGGAGQMIAATLLSDVLPDERGRGRVVLRPTGFGAAARRGAADRQIGGQAAQRVHHRAATARGRRLANSACRRCRS